MGKHAYLIIANRNPNQLNTLISTLDDSRNDIYLLIDKKSINKFYNIFKPMYSSLYMIDPIDIYWGNYSLISAELKLFTSSKDGNYDYYTTNNFNSVIEAVYPDPFKIRFPHPEEYDTNENRILNTLIYNALKDYSNEVKEHIRKFQDKYIKK